MSIKYLHSFFQSSRQNLCFASQGIQIDTTSILCLALLLKQIDGTICVQVWFITGPSFRGRRLLEALQKIQKFWHFPELILFIFTFCRFGAFFLASVRA